MGYYIPAWSLQEYERNEPKRLPATELQTEQLYYLAMPNRTDKPDAYRALVRVEDLQWNLGTLALGIRYITRDLQSHPRTQPSSVNNDYWIPDERMVMTNPRTKASIIVDIGYFLTYEDPLDDELQKAMDSLSLTSGS